LFPEHPERTACEEGRELIGGVKDGDEDGVCRPPFMVLEEPSGRVDKGEAVEVGVVEDLRLEMLWFAGVLKDRDSEDADTGESGLGDEFRADSELLGEDRLMGDDKEGSGWPAKTKAKFEEADKVL